MFAHILKIPVSLCWKSDYSFVDKMTSTGKLVS